MTRENITNDDAGYLNIYFFTDWTQGGHSVCRQVPTVCLFVDLTSGCDKKQLHLPKYISFTIFQEGILTYLDLDFF